MKRAILVLTAIIFAPLASAIMTACHPDSLTGREQMELLTDCNENLSLATGFIEIGGTGFTVDGILYELPPDMPYIVDPDGRKAKAAVVEPDVFTRLPDGTIHIQRTVRYSIQ